MRTLLLADDSITVQRVIALTFAGEPIQVVAVGDGQQAMEKMAAQRPTSSWPARRCRSVNGYDLAQFMRSKTELQHGAGAAARAARSKRWMRRGSRRAAPTGSSRNR